MASGFLGELLDPAEADLRAADYLRKRADLVTKAMGLIIERLDAHAREFESRGTLHVTQQFRGLSDDAEDLKEADRDAEGLIRAIKRNIRKKEPGPDHIDSRLSSIAEAVDIGDLQAALKLIGEELELPAVQGANPQTESDDVASQPRIPQRSQSPRKQTAPAPPTPAPRVRAAAPAGDDAFFGVVVPPHEHEKALLIIADARERAADEGHYRNSPYASGRGRNEWQPKLLKAAFAKALEELASAEAGEEATAVEDITTDAEIGAVDADDAAPFASLAEPDQDFEPADSAQETTATSLAKPSEEHAEPEAIEPAAPTADDDVETNNDPALLSAEPADEEFFGEEDDEPSSLEALADEGADDLNEPFFEDPDDAPVITEPLQPLPRPQPTVLNVGPVSRTAPPPVRPPGSGLMASRVGARPVAPPITRDRV